MPQRGESVRIGSMPGIRRLPFYLTILRRLSRQEREVISAVALAGESGQAVSVVKKDIEMTGAAGKTGVGYEVGRLIADIEGFLGWNTTSKAFLAGAGNLGSALLGYEGFRRYGLEFVAAFDNDPDKIGSRVHGVEIFPIERLPEMAGRLGIKTAALAVPGDQAQAVADVLVAAGIDSIWSFAPVMLSAPEHVVVQREDLSAGLAELMVRRRAAAKTT